MWRFCRNQNVSQVVQPKYTVETMNIIKTANPILDNARESFLTSRSVYLGTLWDLAHPDSKARALKSLIKLGQDVLDLDPENIFVQEEVKRFKDILTSILSSFHDTQIPELEVTEQEPVTKESPDIEAAIEVADEFKDCKHPRLRQQARTLVSDFKKLHEGKMDYATMRSLYG